ncbi:MULTISPECIES: hypothetical protein [Actinomadura]|uniref:Sporulation and spore germination n=1 Tax=Actinomadura litoris TaxID=2678616 RepID=A0A7K1L754_9ACTN|nr:MULTISPECIES: hypothetical protein [Actinomadura]MBT2209576.1 hypothetical protein [Actinomadura sp. NEAU-AAG7]MUN40267.1 hypothetical protein [Actinomadura litoris]
MRRHGAAVLAAALAAVLLGGVLASGCGVRPTGVLSAGDRPVAAGSQAAAITVYLVRGDRLVPVVRPGLPGQPYLSIGQLSVPPTASDLALGLHTEVAHTLVARVVGDPSVLIVDQVPTDERRRWRWSRLALAQIACTAQAISGVERVQLWNGPAPDQHGWGRISCAQFQDLLD